MVFVLFQITAIGAHLSTLSTTHGDRHSMMEVGFTSRRITTDPFAPFGLFSILHHIITEVKKLFSH